LQEIGEKYFIGAVAGLVGITAKNLADLVFRRGRDGEGEVRTEEDSQGKFILGLIKYGTGILGGIGAAGYLRKAGRDRLVSKGVITGLAVGSVTDSLNRLAEPGKRQKRRDSLAGFMANAAYGLVTVAVAARFEAPRRNSDSLDEYIKQTRNEVEKERIKQTPVRYRKYAVK